MKAAGQQNEAAAYWQSLCRRVARRRNLAAMAPVAADLFAWICAAAAVVTIIFRIIPPGAGSPRSFAASCMITGVAFALAAAIALIRHLRGQGRWSQRDAAAMIEDRLRLESRLSAAMDGVASWPAPQRFEERPPRVTPLLPPFLCGLALVLLAARLPITLPGGSSSGQSSGPPPAADRIGKRLAQIEALAILERETLSDFRNRLEQLSNRADSAAWDHARIEALDQLEAEINGKADAAESALQRAAAASRALRDLSATINSPETGAREAGDRGAETPPGGLSQQLRQELLDALQRLGASEISMDRETLEKLQGSLNDAQGAMAADDELLKQLEQSADRLSKLGSRKGRGENGGDGQEREPGSGGISRGPGEAPINFMNRTEGEAGSLERIPSADGSLPRPGQFLGTTSSAPEQPDAAAGPAAGGSLNAPGVSAIAAEQLRPLSPSERGAMKRFFE